MTSEEQEALLARTRDGLPMAITTAVRRCTDLLRARDWDATLLRALVERLVELSTHESPRPRQAVAEALPYLPDDVYAALQPKLEDDASPYVREAAKDAVAKRAKKRREEAQHEEQDARLARWHAMLEPAERRVAGWIATLLTEYYVRREHHEIGNIYASIDGSLDKLDEVTGGHVELARLRGHYARMRRVHDDARKNARTVEPEYERTNLRALVASEAEELATQFPDRAERLDVDLTGVDRRIELEADQTYLRQAFGNILRNAVEAYDAGAARIRVAVSARVEGGDAVIELADEGSGMNDEQMARAFVPFGSTKPGGTGFGLYNAKKVARQIHGGDLEIASAEGAGTTVTMTLPLRQEAPRKRTRRRTRS
jgi:signal transduction histidine kinase